MLLAQNLMLWHNNKILKIGSIWRIVILNSYTASFIKDCFLDSCPKSILFGVFDGHGGPSVSNYLVKNLPGVISLSISR